MSVFRNLKSFNRKERFYVVQLALGGTASKLSLSFRQAVDKVLGTKIPEDHFYAIDYHLDWLYAAIIMDGFEDDKHIEPNLARIIKGNQEDIDLLIAYEEADVTHIIALEAKGVTGWSNEQLDSKAKRLIAIFGNECSNVSNVKPYLGLLSPKKPVHVSTTKWANWMHNSGNIAWLELPLREGLKRVVRTDSAGRPSQGGVFWRVMRG